MLPIIKEKLSLVPNLPGSYQMLDENGTIIYVGKAKNLHRRLSSYFNREQTGKTKRLVEDIRDFTYIIATSETEAFLIEINLIKKYDPKYNIMLRDDKSYPYIEYISKPYPKLKISRYLNIKKKDNKLLFGPYPNAYAARRIVNLLNRLYPLKKCEGNPKEVCLYYHIGECLGYCSKKLDIDKVKKMEEEILDFLKGNDKTLKNKIVEKMNAYSKNLNFEMALELKQELEYIDYITEKQKVELHDLVNRDCIGYYIKNGYASINIFYLRNGKLVGSKNEIFSVTNELEEIEYYIATFYLKHEVPKEIIISDELNISLLESTINTKFVCPKKGIKKELLKMAIMNAKINYENEIKLLEKDYKRTIEANEELAKLLNIPTLNRIDIFDNSNLFGEYCVSGMVVFYNGLPKKNEYRKYKISLDKNDDYHTMQEVIYRRYYRALVDKTKLPELIIVDGGKTQVEVANEVMSKLDLNIPIAGLFKTDKHRTSGLLDSSYVEHYLDDDKSLFFLLTRMQDEVHRYAITTHIKKRNKSMFNSVFDNINGIGEKRKEALIKAYPSINELKNAKIEELMQIIPESAAKELYNKLRGQ